MSSLNVITPAMGCRVVYDDHHTLLIGQPPEVLKGLMHSGIKSFDTLLMLDSREKDGSLLNNLEFPLYFFLFFSDGLAQNKKLNLIGDAVVIEQMQRLLQLTLFGPDKKEFKQWATDNDLADEWLAVSNSLALKNAQQQVLQISDFFNMLPFVDDKTSIGGFDIHHTAIDEYDISNAKDALQVSLQNDNTILPAYNVAMDYVSSGLVKFGLEVLGGASGFSQDEPCTGIALCHNGDYLLIDSIPFLDQHLYARGISKNQISAVFLTHLHDDHCSMFPLMLMPHCVDIISTKEIYNMALEKLACQLGWSASDVDQYFNFVEVRPDKRINYFGLSITAHVTVHSIPTIGAVFSLSDKGIEKTICVVGDNHSMAAVKEMAEQKIVRQQTYERLHTLFTHPFDLLVADGGAGAIHGDPIDALESKSDRIVFVHVDSLPESLMATFSLASSGKRYTLLEGDVGIYTSQISHYLSLWLGQEFPSRWMRCLLAEQEIIRYNRDDVVIVQGAPTKGCVYLILSGYCDVIHQQNDTRDTVAQLQAGDIIGEMAAISGHGVRNASVVARTPMSVCALREDTFTHFIENGGLKEKLVERWRIRPFIKQVPQFSDLSSTVKEKVIQFCEVTEFKANSSQWINDDRYVIFIQGEARYKKLDDVEHIAQLGDEFGFCAFNESLICQFEAISDCICISIQADKYVQLLKNTPQFNYQLSKLKKPKE